MVVTKVSEAVDGLDGIENKPSCLTAATQLATELQANFDSSWAALEKHYDALKHLTSKGARVTTKRRFKVRYAKSKVILGTCVWKSEIEVGSI